MTPRIAGTLLLVAITTHGFIVFPENLTEPDACTIQKTNPDEEIEELAQGWRASYTSGERSVDRIDPRIAFHWKTSPPDQRLTSSEFQAKWRAELLIQTNAPISWHAWVRGTVSIRSGETSLLEGTRDELGWISGKPVALGAGDRPITIEYKSGTPRNEQGNALKIYWSSPEYPLEPIPSRLVFHQPDSIDQAHFEIGRLQYYASRCGQCHEPVSRFELPAPTLTPLRSSRSVVIDKLLGKSKPGKMPQFQFTLEQARAIADFVHPSSTLGPEKPVPNKPEDRLAGENLFLTLGCLACHTRTMNDQVPVGSESLFSGGTLDGIGKRRTIAWIRQWLLDPESLDKSHRMPQFDLGPLEARQLSVFLAGDDTPELELLEKGRPPSPELGERLIREAGCVRCHEIPNFKNSDKQALPIVKPDSGCLGNEPSASRPLYPDLDRRSLDAFLKARSQRPAPDQEEAELLLASRQCFSCHARDEEPGLARLVGDLINKFPDRKIASNLLIPPALHAIGDQLNDQALETSLRGGGKRLTWLNVRMPRFQRGKGQETDAVLRLIRDYFIERDRIPAGVPIHLPPAPSLDASTRLAGQMLLGGEGFSCTACHRLGRFEPKQVAVGTRGSDLLLVGKRLRREFFFRWMHNPSRIVPGMEMPGLEKGVDGILQGELEPQLAALWEVLQNGEITLPSDPSVVAQHWLLKKGDQPRIIRDVFSLPSSEVEEFVPRSLAVGFDNQHSFLFDLDRMALREWWVGSFAKQRTSGKSWYWNVAGARLAHGNEGWQFHDGKTWIEPELVDTSVGRLIDYSVVESKFPLEGFTKKFLLRYRLRFRSDSKLIEPLIIEEWSPVDNIGLRRIIRVESPGKLRINLPSLEAGARIEGGKIGEWTEVPETGLELRFLTEPVPSAIPTAAKKIPVATQESIPLVPGFETIRLPLSREIMPTAITWDADGNLVFTSLRGSVHRLRDSNRDGVQDQLELVEEGLAAPYGILADGPDLLVSHKPELLRLRDSNGDGKIDERTVLATGWGYSDNYHDWTCGIVRDRKGNLYVGLGSDYAQPQRKKETSRYRGHILRISPEGTVDSIASAFRYPTGLALDSEDRLFVTDNQGEQNTFNEINHIREGAWYGVPGRFDEKQRSNPLPPAIQIPHPWTRSVNGIAFFPKDSAHPFAGQGIGCDYDTRSLIRFTTQIVGDSIQGAVFPFSLRGPELDRYELDGFLSCAIEKSGDIYVGGIVDSGWLGGPNQGGIYRIKLKEVPFGISDIQATSEGLKLVFTRAFDRDRAADQGSYSISGYTRTWKGEYATEDSVRHTVKPLGIVVQDQSVFLRTPPLRPGFVYEIRIGKIGPDPNQNPFPAEGHFTFHTAPE